MKVRLMLYLPMLILAISTSFAWAGDEGLYGKQPPANASFFRVVNATDASPVEVIMDGAAITTVAPLNVTRYGFSEQAKTTFSLNSVPLTVATPPGQLLTLVWNGEKAFTINEEPFADKKKARLKLFNLSDGEVSLLTAEKKAEVIGKVASQTYGFRDVNALTLPFTVASGEKAMVTTDEIALHKGVATTVFYITRGSSALYITSEEKR